MNPMEDMKHANAWLEAPTHLEQVPIPRHRPTHALTARITGPPRKDTEPVLVWINGAGAPLALHVKLQDRLSADTPIRCLFYDRAGYDRSTLPASHIPGQSKIMAKDTAKDLMELLDAIDLKPPWIIAAHSYGGIIAREFVALADERYMSSGGTHSESPSGVVGMILFDCATELALAFFPRVPVRELEIVAQDVDFAGLTSMQDQYDLSDNEWMEAIQASERTRQAARDEDTHGSAHQLALRNQLENHALGNRPLAIIRANSAKDYQLLYDEGVRLGNGTEQERQKAQDFIDTWKLFTHQFARAQLDLVHDHYTIYDYMEDFGHDAPLRQTAAHKVSTLVNDVRTHVETGEWPETCV